MIRLMLNTVAGLFVLAVVAIGAQQVAPDYCRRIAYHNRLHDHHGLVVCGVEPMDPPTPAEMEQLYACMDRLSVGYNRELLDGFQFFSVEDLIQYPNLRGGTMMGVTDFQSNRVYVRRGMMTPQDQRATLLHEAMHTVRGFIPYHDSAFEACAGV